MPVILTAVLQMLFYLCAIPVHLAVASDGLRAGTGLSAFDPLRAKARAERALGAPSGGGKGTRAWRVLLRLRFERASLTGVVALGDAAATALACGALNGLACTLRGRVRRLTADVRPDFSGEPRIALRGMLRARSGQIILAAIKTLVTVH